MKDSKKSSLLGRLDKFQRLFFVALLSVLAVGAFAQSKTVSGTVLDKTGESVIGASVVVKGTTNGTITDFDGKFTLQNVPDNGTIQVSFVGYKTVDIQVKGQSTVKVILEEDTETLDEVVVVGYGVVKKSDVTGALTKVSEKQIKERPVQNALQAMQGKAPGVDITTNSRPGELGDVRIRGNRSITADNDPLYVIDGIPMVAGSIADINPNDVESMEILKDASATAIYGSRGANGVVLITTKKGKVGKVSINYDGTVTFSKIHSMTDWMDSGELIDWKRQAYINTGAYSGTYGNAPDPNIDGDLLFSDNGGGVSNYPYLNQYFQKAWEYNADGSYKMRPATDYEKEVLGYADQVPVYNSANIPTTPWTDYVTRTAITHNHQISLSAGSEKSNLYISLAYLDQESPMKDQDFKRYTANINGEIQATNFLKVGMGMNASHSIKNYGIINNTSNSTYKDSYGYAVAKMPFAPAYDEEGKPLNVDGGPSQYNPMLDVYQATNETRYYSVMFNSYGEIDFGKIWSPVEGLKWRTNLGTQYRNSRYGSYYGNDFSNPLKHSAYAANTAFNQQGQNLSWTLENLIYYNKIFKNIHSVGLTLMQSAEYSRAEGLEVRAYNCTFPTALWYSVGNSDLTMDSPGSSFSEQKRASYMARMNYGLMDKYLLTVTGRWDGASMLAVGNKWDFFPSAALAWDLKQENFLKENSFIDQLKLRLGYGSVGNQAVEAYRIYSKMTPVTVTTPNGSSSTAYKIDRPAAPFLKWERNDQFNVGVDFGILNGRVRLTADWYSKLSKDILLEVARPSHMGYTAILDNAGEIKNTGVEFTISADPFSDKEFSWHTDLTLSHNKGTFNKIPTANHRQQQAGNFQNQIFQMIEGEKLGSFWGYTFAGVWQEDDVNAPFVDANGQTNGKTNGEVYKVKPGNSKYVDVNKDGVYNDADQGIIGCGQPTFNWGWNNTFNYKNFDFSFFVVGFHGFDIYNATHQMGYNLIKSQQMAGVTPMRELLNRWTPTNTNTDIPGFVKGGTENKDFFSTRFVENGSFIKMKSITLGYTLPEATCRSLGINNLRVYASVQNPFHITKYSGLDPEATMGSPLVQGVDWGAYPNSRNYLIGLNFSF